MSKELRDREKQHSVNRKDIKNDRTRKSNSS